MTVHNPVFPDCPSCGSQTLHGVEKVGTKVHTDGQGGVHHFVKGSSLSEWVSLWCDDCGKMMIEDGEWVIDPVDGKPIVTDGSGFRTFDQFTNDE